MAISGEKGEKRKGKKGLGGSSNITYRKMRTRCVAVLFFSKKKKKKRVQNTLGNVTPAANQKEVINARGGRNQRLTSPHDFLFYLSSGSFPGL
jgi:hypothetical protein